MQTLRFKDYDGENVQLVSSIMKGSYKVLQNKHSMLTDFLEIVFKVLERCMVKKFVMYVCGIKTNHDQKAKYLTLIELLNKVEQKYIQLEGS